MILHAFETNLMVIFLMDLSFFLHVLEFYDLEIIQGKE